MTIKRSIGVTTRHLSSGKFDRDDGISFQTSLGAKSYHSNISSCTTTDSSSSAGDEDDFDTPEVVQVATYDEVSLAREMVKQLSTKDKQTAACSSYSYYNLSLRRNDTKRGSILIEKRDEAAMAMAIRHLKADKGDVNAAMQHLRNTIAWRRNQQLDALRSCFSESTSEEALDFQRRLHNFVGEKGKLIIQGFDREHRACWHTVGRHSPKGTHLDHDGCMLAHYYMLERALACSEARSLEHGATIQETVIVSVDFNGFKTQHAPPLSTVKELLLALRDHYPERLFRVYLVDAPLVFRGLWNLIKPFIDSDTKAKFQFVTGATQRARIFGEAMGASQCMPYQHPEGKQSDDINMDVFYSLPFDVAYGGVAGEYS